MPALKEQPLYMYSPYLTHSNKKGFFCRLDLMVPEVEKEHFSMKSHS